MASELTPWQHSQGLGDEEETVVEVSTPAAPASPPKKRTRKKPEETQPVSPESATPPRKATDWSLGFTIVDN